MTDQLSVAAKVGAYRDPSAIKVRSRRTTIVTMVSSACHAVVPPMSALPSSNVSNHVKLTVIVVVNLAVHLDTAPEVQVSARTG